MGNNDLNDIDNKGIGSDSKNALKGSTNDLNDIDNKGIGYESKNALKGFTEGLNGIDDKGIGYDSKNALKGSTEGLNDIDNKGIGYESKNALKGSTNDLNDIDNKGIGYESKNALRGSIEPLEVIDYDTKDNDTSGTIIASISLALLLVPKLLILGLFFIQPKLEELQDILMNVSPICYIVGLVLMIITRVHYPKNKMGKISMWLYISITIIEVIICILAILLVVWLCGSCIEILPECGKIG